VVLIFFSGFLLLTFLIPISLNVSIEVIKGFLGTFLTFDRKMFHEPINKGCSVNNVSIIEELGQIDYILTDKTGTLTANEMVFKNLCVGGYSYTSSDITSNI
jgi:P-type E1-E2 ATPase